MSGPGLQDFDRDFAQQHEVVANSLPRRAGGPSGRPIRYSRREILLVDSWLSLAGIGGNRGSEFYYMASAIGAGAAIMTSKY